MNSEKKKIKAPAFHVEKREGISFRKACAIRATAVVLSLIVCAIVIVLITGQNPLEVYGGIIDGAVGTSRRFWVTVRETVILLLIAVGLVPVFRMKFWNIGAEGQILMGATASAALMIYIKDSIPNFLLILIIMIGGMVVGMLWAFIPAFFKANYNTNETLFTLMMNYIAMQIVNCLIVIWENPVGSNTVGIINGATKAGWFPSIFGNAYALNIIITLVATVCISVYMKMDKHGYEIDVVGAGTRTALYAGINVKKVICRTMMLSGALCGLAGSVIVSGASHTISTSTAGGRGFTAIIVAWMSKFNPIAMLAISAFLSFMQQGAIQIASQFGLNENASDIITGILLFFLIGCEFFINYRMERTDRGDTEDKAS
ncbi:MAG: ABC transporter permease [Lachnospiraceae bacterium]|nr:ABC transporter permease [Lachnospiraceae bacterium]